jgi:hypothetical protein
MRMRFTVISSISRHVPGLVKERRDRHLEAALAIWWRRLGVRLGDRSSDVPAAGRSRDDRHLPRHRAIQSGKKITPADQPGLRSIHRQRPALVPAPDAQPPTTQSSRYQASARSVNGA